MKRLNKAQLKIRSELTDALRTAQTKVGQAILEVNSVIDGQLNDAIAEYNGALSELESFRDEIVSEMETYINERSDKWRDSDAASNYDSWKQDWDGVLLDEIEQIDNIEEPDLSHADEFEGLAEEVES